MQKYINNKLFAIIFAYNSKTTNLMEITFLFEIKVHNISYNYVHFLHYCSSILVRRTRQNVLPSFAFLSMLRHEMLLANLRFRFSTQKYINIGNN